MNKMKIALLVILSYHALVNFLFAETVVQPSIKRAALVLETVIFALGVWIVYRL